MRVVALALALAACGDNLPDPSVAHSGRRLKLGWYVYEGGARELERDWYFDAALGERCTRRLWSDGRYYCTPAVDEAVFINAACTRALGRTLAGFAPARFFATTFKLAGEPQPAPSRLFGRGDPTLPPVAIWRKTITGCIPGDLDDSYDYFELGGEIVIAKLAPLRRRAPQGGDLAVIAEVSDDGASVPVALYDRAAGSDCTLVERPNADRVECLPASAPTAAFFHDAACSEAVVAAPSAPELALRYDVPTSCWHAYRVDDEVSAPPLYEHTGVACLETAPPGGQRLFATADEQPLASLAREREPSPARIGTITRHAGALSVADPLLYDAELATDCRHDDALRCAPATDVTVFTAARRAFFADAQCQTALDLAFARVGGCQPPPRFGKEEGRYYPVGEPYSGPLFVPSTGDTCSGYVPDVPYVAFTIGPQLDPASLVQAELVIDP